MTRFEEGYLSGYGQAKADIKEEIASSLRLLSSEAYGSLIGEDAALNPTDEQRKSLSCKLQAMQWVRAMIGAMK